MILRIADWELQLFLKSLLKMSRLCYIAEWLDNTSGVVWKYQLFYYPESKEVEVSMACVCGCVVRACMSEGLSL